MTEPGDLVSLRAAIEAVDREILERLKRRMTLAEGVAAAKLESAVPFRDPSREQQVITRVRQTAVELGLDPHEVERLYRLIMEMAIARQQTHVRERDTVPLRIAYQGVEGSYSHLAAQRHYAGRKGGVLLTGYDTLAECADALHQGQADMALLPIENTAAGGMSETYDLLAEGRLTIVAEVVSPVEHRLLGLPGATGAGLRVILSHPQAFAQCQAFLRTVPHVRLQPELDTALAARKVREAGDPSRAAIASAAAGERFGLVPLPVQLQAVADYTRYVELAREATSASTEGGSYKTTLLMALEDRPGALGDVLRHFAQAGVNLAKIESRPLAGSPGHYRFYLDVEGHAASAEVTAAFAAIKPLCAELRVLGTYPAAVREDGPPVSLRVALLGGMGTFSEEAAWDLFGQDWTPVPAASLLDVLGAVNHQVADALVLPVENSIAGPVGESLDGWRSQNLLAFAETAVSVHHCLVALPGVAREELQEVWSHPQALAQCAPFLRAHRLRPIPVASTVAGVEAVAQRGDRRVAALGTQRAAERWNLTVLAENVQSVARNFTRFVALSRTPRTKPTGNDRTSLALWPPGGLSSLPHSLELLEAEGVQLLHMHVRPIPEHPWNSLLFLDVTGHADEPQVAAALESLGAGSVQWLGSYPAKVVAG